MRCVDMQTEMKLVVTTLLLLLLAIFCDSKKFILGEEIPVTALWASPLNNVNERCRYTSLPICQVAGFGHSGNPGLSDALLGNYPVSSGITLKFAKEERLMPLCQSILTDEMTKSLEEVIHANYWYKFMIDDVPVWGMLGFEEDNDYFVYSHKRFSLSYGDGQLVHANLTCENPVAISDSDTTTINYTYAVYWEKSEIEYTERFETLLDSNFFSNKVYLFARFNTGFFMVFILYALYSLYTKKIKRIIKGPMIDDENIEKDIELTMESRWKLLREDVFRNPSYTSLFSPLMGIGVQLIFLSLIVSFMSFAAKLYYPNNDLLTVFVTTYVALTFLASYISGAHYARRRLANWIRVFIITTLLLPVVFSVFIFSTTLIAISNEELISLAVSHIVSLFALFAVNMIVGLFGTILGRNLSGLTSESTFKVNSISKLIPKRSLIPRIVKATFFCSLGPFMILFFDIYTIYSCVWGYKIYSNYGDLLLSMILAFVATAVSSVLQTFATLNQEDYRVEWNSFLGSATIAIPMQLFNFYFFYNSKMTGLYQTVYYFTITTIFSLMIGIANGTIGCLASMRFVKILYMSIKFE